MMKMSSVKPTQKGGIKGKIICKYFMLGKCIKGENCPYLHSQVEKPKDEEVECPMYSIGFCKNGPVCHFLHIKKDKYVEEEIEDKNTTSTTPNGEGQNTLNINTNNEHNMSNTSENNLNNDKNSEEKEINDKKEDNMNYPEIPIWYIEHYYNKPLSMIFSELEQKNLPEIIQLKKKYGFTNIEPNLPVMQPINKKNSKTNINMNTLNLNFNNFNMNLAFNANHKDMSNQKNNIMQNSIQLNQLGQMNQMNQINSLNEDIKFDAYKLKKDSIEYLINKEDNIFYYLIRCKNYDEIKKSLESNTMKLPEELYNKYKDIDIKNNKLTIIIFVYDDECENFGGFAQLKYPLAQKKTGEETEEEKNALINCYKIEWLWRTKLHYSKVSHLMNRADNDHFLNEGKNGCPIDKDLGNYCCRLMIKRLSKDEVKELINEKKMFERQQSLLLNLKKEDQHPITNTGNNYQKKASKNTHDIHNSHDRHSNYGYSDKKYSSSKYNDKLTYKYSNKKSFISDTNSSNYNSSGNKSDFKYTGHKKYRNNSKSINNNRSDSEDYSSSYNKNKKMKLNDEKNNGNNNNNYKYKNNYSKNKFSSKKDYKEYNYNNYYRSYTNDDNKSTDFSSKKSYHS